MYCNSVLVTVPSAKFVAFIPVPIASVTSPEVPPPVKPVPAVTLVMSPIVLKRFETKTFFVLSSVASCITR